MCVCVCCCCIYTEPWIRAEHLFLTAVTVARLEFSSFSPFFSPFSPNSFEGSMLLLPVHATMVASQENYFQILKFESYTGQLIYLPILLYG